MTRKRKSTLDTEVVVADHSLGSDALPIIERKFKIPKLSPEDAKSFEEAQQVVASILKKQQFLMWAALEHYDPNKDLDQADETEPPFLDAVGLEDFKDLLELSSDVVAIQRVFSYMGLPEQVTNPVLQGFLMNEILPSKPSVSSLQGIVSVKKGKGNDG